MLELFIECRYLANSLAKKQRHFVSSTTTAIGKGLRHKRGLEMYLCVLECVVVLASNERHRPTSAPSCVCVLPCATFSCACNRRRVFILQKRTAWTRAEATRQNWSFNECCRPPSLFSFFSCNLLIPLYTKSKPRDTANMISFNVWVLNWSINSAPAE